jgi:hypothetical protein
MRSSKTVSNREYFRLQCKNFISINLPILVHYLVWRATMNPDSLLMFANTKRLHGNIGSKYKHELFMSFPPEYISTLNS